MSLGLALQWGFAAALLAPASALQQDQAAQRPRQEPPAVLLRSPAELPHAAEGRWKDWKPTDAVPKALAEDLKLAMRLYLQAQDHPGALEVLYQLLEREPDFPPALYQAGSAAFRLRRYGDAAAFFERFLAAVPHEVAATQALGHCYYSLGRFEAARAHYERVLAVAPGTVEALRGLALTRVRLGELAPALELLERVLAARPDHAEALLWKAQVLFDLERSEDALAPAQRALELAPFEPRPHFLLGQILQELDRAQEAQACQKRFLELSILDQKVRTLEGHLLVDPRSKETLLRLAELHKAAGNAQGVRSTLERLVAVAPDLDTHLLALEGLLAVGEEEAAAQLAQRVETRFADQAPAWRALRDFYARSGDRVRQIQAGERYLRLGGDPKR